MIPKIQRDSILIKETFNYFKTTNKDFLSLAPSNCKNCIFRRCRSNGTYRIISHVTAGRAKMDDGRSQRTLLTKYVNMGHHIVPRHLFFLGGRFEVDVVDVLLHLGDLFRFDGQTEFLKASSSLSSSSSMSIFGRAVFWRGETVAGRLSFDLRERRVTESYDCWFKLSLDKIAHEQLSLYGSYPPFQLRILPVSSD